MYMIKINEPQLTLLQTAILHVYHDVKNVNHPINAQDTFLPIPGIISMYDHVAVICIQLLMFSASVQNIVNSRGQPKFIPRCMSTGSEK